MNEPSISQLADLLLDTGMLQFGLFRQGEEFVPFRFSLGYLPAYPQALSTLASAASALIADMEVDRLVAVPDALPFGVALSLQTGCSLAYSRGKGEEAAFDLVGAYNAGHRAVLLTNVLHRYEPLLPLVADTHRVGLDVRTVLALVDLGLEESPANLEACSVLRLPEGIPDLVSRGRLPDKQADAVLNWLERQA